MDREINNSGNRGINHVPASRIDIQDYESVFNSFRKDVREYLSANYLGVEASDFQGLTKIKEVRDYGWIRNRIKEHKMMLDELCGEKASREKRDFELYDDSVNYIVNVMNGILIQNLNF